MFLNSANDCKMYINYKNLSIFLFVIVNKIILKVKEQQISSYTSFYCLCAEPVNALWIVH